MRRFPLGLTAAVLAIFAILVGLGLWQLDRLKETNANRAAIAALGRAPARTLAAVLGDPGRADHARVEVDCLPPAAPPPTTYRYALPGGVVGWRLLTMCPIQAARFDGILLDRGVVTQLDGAMEPSRLDFPPPASLTGVLRKLGRKPLFGDDMPSTGAQAPSVRVIDPAATARIAARAGLRTPAPWYIVVERETPSPPGVAPALVTEDTPRDNFGYALTWFGLAIALLGVWGGFVWRRMKSG